MQLLQSTLHTHRLRAHQVRATSGGLDISCPAHPSSTSTRPLKAHPTNPARMHSSEYDSCSTAAHQMLAAVSSSPVWQARPEVVDEPPQVLHSKVASASTVKIPTAHKQAETAAQLSPRASQKHPPAAAEQPPHACYHAALLLLSNTLGLPKPGAGSVLGLCGCT
jgi:hypothetical protein